LAALPASALLAQKPNSKFDGVQVGVITYSYFPVQNRPVQTA
jgi:hypothetical protein